MTFEPLFAQPRVAFFENEEHLPAGEITITNTPNQPQNTTAIVLLAIATVHADLRLPAITPGS
jgi:hypothetical protein